MKLYATVQSERATKGQGGQKFINIEVKDEKENIIVSGRLETFDNGISIYFTTIGQSHNQSINSFYNYFTDQKGKKQKDEKTCKHEFPSFHGTCQKCGINRSMV